MATFIGINASNGGFDLSNIASLAIGLNNNEVDVQPAPRVRNQPRTLSVEARASLTAIEDS
jgi:hypothetical protein